MLDGILGRGFSSKCKSLIKATRTRIDVIRRRKEATQRFLKGNLAQLLANGLDINAYGRTEEFLAGLNLLSCYNFIDKSCEYILKQLSVMQKQRECPEECRQAVGSLMFAAARFSDLPELRDLRDTLQERYGDSLEHFVNQEFVEKLASRPPPTEKKIQLLQDIALEFSIKWDSRGFEQRMANPFAFPQGQPTKYGPIPVHADKYELLSGKETGTKTEKWKQSSKDTSELIDDRYSLRSGREDDLLKRDEVAHRFNVIKDLTGDSRKSLTAREQTMSKRDEYDIPFQGRREFVGDKHESLNGKEDTAVKTVRPGHSSHGRRAELEVHNNSMNGVPNRESQHPVSDREPEVDAKVARVPGRHDGKDVSSVGCSNYGQPTTADSRSKIQEEKTDGLKSYSSKALPPPYTKPKDKHGPPPYIKPTNRNCGFDAEVKHATDYNGMLMDPSLPKRGHSVRRTGKASGDDAEVKHETDYDGTLMDPSLPKRDHVVRWTEKISGESDHPDFENGVAGPARVSSQGDEKEVHYRDGIPLPKPRSHRRKHSKSSSGHDDLAKYEDNGVGKRSSSSRRRDDPSGHDDLAKCENTGVGKRSSSSRRRDDPRRGLQILFDDEHYQKDEEERKIDKLLLHYSKKPSSFEPEKARRKSKFHASYQRVADTGETSRDGPDVQEEDGPLSTRSVSLPREQTSSAEVVKVYARANSFQPDNQAKHVHPKLPDYDDLAARFAALKGR